MDALNVLPVDRSNVPDIQPVSQTVAARAPEAAAADRQAESPPSVEVQISDAARAAAARDGVGADGSDVPQEGSAAVSVQQEAARSAVPAQSVAEPSPSLSPSSASVSQAAGTDGQVAERVSEASTSASVSQALRLFADNAGVGVEQATTAASPLRVSA